MVGFLNFDIDTCLLNLMGSSVRSLKINEDICYLQTSKQISVKGTVFKHIFAKFESKQILKLWKHSLISAFSKYCVSMYFNVKIEEL